MSVLRIENVFSMASRRYTFIQYQTYYSLFSIIICLMPHNMITIFSPATRVSTSSSYTIPKLRSISSNMFKGLVPDQVHAMIKTSQHQSLAWNERMHWFLIFTEFDSLVQCTFSLYACQLSVWSLYEFIILIEFKFGSEKISEYRWVGSGCVDITND